MASYPKPRYNNSIFLYDTGKSKPSSKVIVPGPSPPDTSVTETVMQEIAQFSNYSYVFASFPWLPAPNVKPAVIYALWNDLVYGEDYLLIAGSTYQWEEELEYILTGVKSTYKITGTNAIDFKATSTRPRGLTGNPQLTLTRPYKPFVIAFNGLSDNCITFEIGTFKMSLMSDYTVIYYVNNVETARSAVLGTNKDINLLAFADGIIGGSDLIQDSTGSFNYTRASQISDIVLTQVNSNSMPLVSESGTGTWTFNNITLNVVNMYDSLTTLNLSAELFLMLDVAYVKTEPPTYIIP